jgi:hypothetical protein
VWCSRSLMWHTSLDAQSANAMVVFTMVSLGESAEEKAAVEVAAPAKMAHDDVIGESIDEHEASQVTHVVVHARD